MTRQLAVQTRWPTISTLPPAPVQQEGTAAAKTGASKKLARRLQTTPKSQPEVLQQEGGPSCHHTQH
jgi:hypothetical protein